MLLACLVLLPLLGHRPLTEWDEGIYAEIAREMLAGGSWHSWLAPHFNGQLWFEKPPLQMWLTACSLRLFGTNALAARLPSALAGIATVGVLHVWLLRRLNHLTAWLGTVLLLSSFGFQHAARTGETDSLLTLFCLIAVLGLAEVLGAHPRGWLLFFLGFGLAVMTKGAAAITLPLTATLLVVTERRQLLRFGASFLQGALLFLLIALPWHAVLLHGYGQAFLHDYLGLHVLHRASTAIEGHLTHPWFYLGVLLVSAPPFALLYPSAILRPLWRHEPTHNSNAPNHALRAFALFALTTLCLFSIARTRLPHYIAPAYPALSALTATLVAPWLQAAVRRHRKLAPWLIFGSVALYAASALLTAPSRRSLHSPRLPGGRLTPDNREGTALLQAALRSHPALPEGPLLLWRSNPQTPVATAAFYGQRLALPVSPLPLPAAGTLRKEDRYAPDPTSLAQALTGPRLILLDRNLEPDLPSAFRLNLLARGATQDVAVLTVP